MFGLNLSPLRWLPRTGISSYVFNLVRALRESPDRSCALSYFLYPWRKAKAGEVEALIGGSGRKWRWPDKALLRLFKFPPLARRGLAGVRVFHETSTSLRPVPSGCRTVYTLYDVLPLIRPEWYSPAAARKYARDFDRSTRRADRIIVQTQAARSDVLEAAPGLEEKLVYIPNGVDTEMYRADSPPGRLESDLAALGVERPYILFTGAIQPRKNVERLARAFFQIAGDIPHTLVLGGPVGWKGGEILEHVFAGPRGDRIRHLGFVPSGVLPSLYRGADLYVFPSYAEGFGLTILEAMASGVPVVTSTLSALPEVAGEAALFAHPDDVDGLARLMRQGLEDGNLRKSLIEKGFARVRQYSWRRTAEVTWGLYRSLAGEN